MDTKSTSFPRRSFVFGGAALGALALMSPNWAFADDAASKQAEADAAYASLQNMQKQLDIASNDYYQALNDQQAARDSMDAAQAQIDEQNEKISGFQAQLSKRARSMYRTGSNSFLDVLLGSATFEEFASNWSMLNTLNDHDAELVQSTRDARDELEKSKAEYARQEQVAADKAAEAERIKNEAESTVAEMKSVYDNLSAEAAELLEQERAAEEAARAAQAAAAVAASAQGGTEYQGGGSDSGSDGGSSSWSDDSSSDSGSSGGSSSGGGATYDGGGDVVSRAYACLGAPYSWGAVGPYAYDCSGLVSYCLSGSHTRLGTTYTFMGWTRVSNPQPGDVATNSYHCGIYIGGGQMIHASDYGIGVIVGPVMSDMIIVRY